MFVYLYNSYLLNHLFLFIFYYQAEGRKKLAILIVNHLVSDVKTDGFDKESTESLDIAIQCLKSTYNLNPTEIENVDVKLEDVIKKYYPDVETMVKINVKKLSF